MSNYAWLCEYSNYSVTKVHGIQATIPECWDAVDLFRLEQKEKAGNATDDEKQKIKMYYDLTKPFSEKWKGGSLLRVNICQKQYLANQTLMNQIESCQIQMK